MKYCILYLFLITITVACNKKKKNPANNSDAEHLELIAADKAFSKMCEQKGMKAAFIEYIDSNGVLLRPNEMPIVGANAIDYLVQQDDQGYSLSWEPRQGEVSKSGDMGYTYGIYAMRLKSKDTVIYGSYASFWKKQHDGKWKLVLDTGNEGIGQDNE